MLHEINSTEDILALKEAFDIEFKKAAGKSEQSMIPKNLWETYSAFANTDGGSIFLGIEESNGNLKIIGINNYNTIIQNLYDLSNNKEKVSCNLIDNNSVKEIKFGTKTVLQIYIPRAKRKDRPVYINGNPLKGSYKRRNEGDYLLDSQSIKKMLAEQGEDSVDGRILHGFNYEEDFDLSSVNDYRNIFGSLQPTHPFISKNTPEFLKLIGAIGKDRETGEIGVTLAGLIMFGKLTSILDALPNYILDYQERPESKTENRWIDRFTTNGMWSGNVFDFYRNVYRKLTIDLKIPFSLKKGTRTEDTPIHEALRESFVNALIHADYYGRVSVLVIKTQDMFEFRNPGLMRVPIEQALEGGDSDCRNRKLQKMFQFIGAGDQAGSGIPKIYQNWKQQHWRTPLIKEKGDPEQTIFELHTVNLIDEKTINILEKSFGKRFKDLQEIERLILATTVIEESTNRKRILEISSQHPSDISKAFSKLVKEGFLISNGEGRGTYYILTQGNTNSEGLPSNSEGLPSNSEGLPSNSEGLPSNSEDIILNEEKYKTACNEVDIITKEKKKLKRSEMESLITKLCSFKPHSRDELSKLLNRNPDFLRQEYINPMINNSKISPIHSDLNHPNQAYKTRIE